MRSVHEASSAGTPTSNLFMLRMASAMAPPPGLPIATLASSCCRRLRSMPMCVCVPPSSRLCEDALLVPAPDVCSAFYLGPELQGL